MSSRTNNKFYSDRQEKMIANYLGWKQVVGSGSRPFIPGDVSTFNWLGECKTHNTEKPTIVFLKSHWLKICEESAAKHRFPVLFKDNGTQLAENTWVMFPLSMISPEIVNIIDGLHNSSKGENTLTFNLADSKQLYSQQAIAARLNVFTINWGSRDIAIVPLSVFRDFLEDNF